MLCVWIKLAAITNHSQGADVETDANYTFNNLKPICVSVFVYINWSKLIQQNGHEHTVHLVTWA